MPREPQKKAFNDRWLKSLKPLKPTDPKYRVPIWDAMTPGLCVRPGAAPAFYVAKRPTGAQKFVWVKLGDYPITTLSEVRSRARETISALIEGRPAPTPTKSAVTFADMAEKYIAEILPPKRTAKDCEQMIRRELIPAIGARPLASIQHNDLVTLLKSIAERSERRGSGRLRSGGPHAMRKVHSELSVMLQWAAFNRIGGLQSDPSAAIPASELLRGRAYTKQRDRVLDDAELRTIWEAAGKTPYPFGPLIRALILTGQRLNEIAQAGWSEIPENGAVLLIPAERMKNEKVHALPLTEQMRSLLAELPRFENGDFMFSTSGGKRPISGFSKMKSRFDRTVAQSGDVASHWLLHDLRRTMRTGLSRCGVIPFHAELVIGHQQSGVHGVYDRFRYHAEKLDALQRWAKLLASIVEPPPENVVSIAARAWA